MAKPNRLQELLNISPEQLNKLNTKELRAVVQTMVSGANKRIKRLEESNRGTNAPAYQKYLERGTKFTTKGKNLNELRNEYKVVKSFLESKTSTVTGFKAFRNKMEKIVGGTFGNEEQEKAFWSLYRKWEETVGGFSKYYDSKTAVKDLHSVYYEHGAQNIIDKINEESAFMLPVRKNEYIDEDDIRHTVNENDEEDILELMKNYGEMRYQQGYIKDNGKYNNIGYQNNNDK